MNLVFPNCDRNLLHNGLFRAFQLLGMPYDNTHEFRDLSQVI